MCILCSIEKRSFFPYNSIQRIKGNENKLKEERKKYEHGGIGSGNDRTGRPAG